MNHTINLLEFPPRDTLLHTLQTKGVLSFPLLDNSARLELLEEAVCYPYRRKKPYIEKYKVVQYFSAFNSFPETSKFLYFADILQKAIIARCEGAAHEAFPVPLAFNDFVLQRYDRNPIGISPHQDGLSRINLVAVLLLTGHARFCICRDRGGRNAEEISSPPGNIILMRAPGFWGEQEQLFHFVDCISEPRYTFGMRQWVKK